MIGLKILDATKRVLILTVQLKWIAWFLETKIICQTIVTQNICINLVSIVAHCFWYWYTPRNCRKVSLLYHVNIPKIWFTSHEIDNIDWKCWKIIVLAGKKFMCLYTIKYHLFRKNRLYKLKLTNTWRNIEVLCFPTNCKDGIQSDRTVMLSSFIMKI